MMALTQNELNDQIIKEQSVTALKEWNRGKRVHLWSDGTWKPHENHPIVKKMHQFFSEGGEGTESGITRGA